MSHSVVGPEVGDEDTGPVTIYDIQAAEESKVRVRALPRLTRQALRIAWAAGRSEFIVSTLLQTIGGGGIALLLLLGQQGLQVLLRRSNAASHSLPSLPGRLRSQALPESRGTTLTSIASIQHSCA